MRENILQRRIKETLESHGWLVYPITGGLYLKGFPDLWCSHPTYGRRLIEVKRPDRWSFTLDQKREFPKILASGCGIWIMQSVADYQKLFKPPNIGDFLKCK